MCRETRTPSDDIKHEDNETSNAAAGRALPRGTLSGNGCGLNQEAQRELEECSDDELKHGDSSWGRSGVVYTQTLEPGRPTYLV